MYSIIIQLNTSEWHLGDIDCMNELVKRLSFDEYKVYNDYEYIVLFIYPKMMYMKLDPSYAWSYYKSYC